MCRGVDEARQEGSKKRLKASPPPPATVRLPWKYIIKGISSRGHGTFGGRLHVLIRAAREFAFSRRWRPRSSRGFLGGRRMPRPPRAKSGDGETRIPSAGRSGPQTTQKRFLGERRGRAGFRKADCTRCGAERLHGPTWPPLRLRAAPRLAVEHSTAGFPLVRRRPSRGWRAPFTAPGPSGERGWQGGAPGEQRGVLGSEGNTVP